MLRFKCLLNTSPKARAPLLGVVDRESKGRDETASTEYEPGGTRLNLIRAEGDIVQFRPAPLYGIDDPRPVNRDIYDGLG